MSPDWSANLHHIVGGALMAFVLVLLLRDRIRGWWLLVACAVGITMIAEAANELAEWKLIRGDDATATAYYDLVADLGTTPFGALLGALLAQAWSVIRSSRRSATSND